MRATPFIVGAVVACATALALHWLGLTPSLPAGDRTAVFGTLAQISGTMLGFLLAALAVVASITDSDLLKRMRETGHYNELLQNLFVGALFFLVCTVVSVLALLGVQFTLWFMALFYGLHAAALVVLLIVGWQFWLTLRNLKPSQ